MTTIEPSFRPPAPLSWLQALRDPGLALAWPLAEWERVVRLSRRLRLLARLAARLESAGLLDQVPAPARRHLVAELRLSQWRTGTLRWAVERVGAMLGDTPYPRVLLKGAAYLSQELPIAAGRLPSDLDVLVPQAHIADAQARLVAAGWVETELDAHDRRYYHEWSHEVPPMRHPLHAMELDLHHNILPPVARTHVDADRLLERLRESPWPGWKVLDPIDQVLHSAAHLFLDGESRDRVRDLVDLDGLLTQFTTLPGFWTELPARARELGLAEPLALALHFAVHWLGTAVPPAAQRVIERQGPGSARRAWLLPLLETALMPAEPDEMPPWHQEAAATVLLVRYHRQRMPLRLLVPHLWHKLRAGRDQARPDETPATERA